MTSTTRGDVNSVDENNCARYTENGTSSVSKPSVFQTVTKSTLSLLERFIVWNKTNMIECDNCSQVYDGTAPMVVSILQNQIPCCEGTMRPGLGRRTT